MQMVESWMAQPWSMAVKHDQLEGPEVRWVVLKGGWRVEQDPMMGK